MIVITGANGFVGQFLVPQLLKNFPKNKIIVAVGRAKKRHEKEGLGVLNKLPVKKIKIDLLEKGSLQKLPKSPNILIHLASAVDTGSTDFRSNDIGTANLIEAVNKMGKNSHLIYTSTAAVWGGRKSFEILTEDYPPNPNNDYGKTKLLAEELLVNKSKQQGFGLTILRLNTVFGKDIRQDKLFGMIQQMLKKRSFTLRFNWPGQFGVVHVDDVGRSIIESIKKPPKPAENRVFIVSTENVSLAYVSKLIAQQLKISYRVIQFPELFWRVIRLSRLVVPAAEKIAPAGIYNLLWRISLITNDVLKADGKKFDQKIAKWKRKRLADHIKEVII